MLDFDPESLIDAFEKERRKQSKTDGDGPRRVPPRVKRITYVPPPLGPVDSGPEAATEPEVVEAEPAVVSPEAITEPEAVEVEPVVVSPEAIEPVAVPVLETEKPRGRWIIGLSLIAVVLLIVTAIALRPGSSTPVSGGGVSEPVVEMVQPDTAIATPVPAPVEPPAAPTVDPGSLSVTASGVGTSVVNHRLVGERTRFEQGSTVVFFNRVEGGVSGQKLRHVWLHEGRVIQSIVLPVGSAHWRTYSSKTHLVKGNWVVEARSADNQVLARVEFSCNAS